MRIQDVKLGMKVKLSRPSETIGPPYWVTPLDAFIGKEVTVDGKPYEDYVTLKETAAFVHANWLTPVNEPLKTGQNVEAVVTAVKPYGIHLDYHGVGIIVHVSDVPWGKNVAPEDYAKVGEKLLVTVKYVGPSGGVVGWLPSREDWKTQKLVLDRKTPPVKIIGEDFELGEGFFCSVCQRLARGSGPLCIECAKPKPLDQELIAAQRERERMRSYDREQTRLQANKVSETLDRYLVSKGMKKQKRAPHWGRITFAIISALTAAWGSFQLWTIIH